jgi:hypothetical protein
MGDGAEGEEAGEGIEQECSQETDEALANVLAAQFEQECGRKIEEERAERGERQVDWVDDKDCGFYLTPLAASLPELGEQSQEALSLEFALRSSIDASEWERAAHAEQHSELADEARHARAFFESATAKLKGLLRQARAAVRREENLAHAASAESQPSDSLKVSDVRRQLISGDGEMLADQSAGGGSRLASTASKVSRIQPRELVLNAILGTPPDAACFTAAIESGLLKEIASWLRKAVLYQKSSLASQCIRALKHLPVDEKALRRFSGAANTVAETARECQDKEVRQRAQELMAAWNDYLHWSTGTAQQPYLRYLNHSIGASTEQKLAGNAQPEGSTSNNISRAKTGTLQAQSRKAPLSGTRSGRHTLNGPGRSTVPHRNGTQPPSKARRLQRQPKWPAPLLVYLPGHKHIARGERSQEKQLEIGTIPHDEDTSQTPAEPGPEEIVLENSMMGQWTPFTMPCEAVEEQELDNQQRMQQQQLMALQAQLVPQQFQVSDPLAQHKTAAIGAR